MTNFQHLWDYEPASMNHWVPNYGQFSQQYFYYAIKSCMNSTAKFSGFKKNVGPPYYHFSADYDPLDKNEYLLSKDVDIDALKGRNKGVALVETPHH